MAVLALALGASQGAGAADAAFTQKALEAAREVKQGRFDRALHRLRDMLKRYPQAADVDLIHWLACKAHNGKGEYVQAVAECGAAIARNNKNANFYLDRGYAHFRLGRAGEAKRDLVAALNKGGTKALTHALLARLALRAGDIAAAETQTALALKRDPKLAEALAVRDAVRFVRTLPDARPLPRPALPAARPVVVAQAPKPAPKPVIAPPPQTPPVPLAAPPPVTQSPVATAPAPMPPKPAPKPMIAPPPPRGGPDWWANTPPIPAYQAAPPSRHGDDAAPSGDLDCARPRAEAERLICRDERLRRDARALDRLFRRAQAIAAAPAAMAADQHDWIMLVRNRCHSAGCLDAVYAERRLELMLWIGD